MSDFAYKIKAVTIADLAKTISDIDSYGESGHAAYQTTVEQFPLVIPIPEQPANGIYNVFRAKAKAVPCTECNDFTCNTVTKINNYTGEQLGPMCQTCFNKL